MQQPDFLNSLNPTQREAVMHTDGPSLVIAGAGSGKTRVLTYKIAYLLTTGIKPWEIMALTFTNKAAREMKERIGQLVAGDMARYLRMGTFHSIFARILRSEATAIGYDSNFTIYDEADSRSLIKSIIKELALNDKVYKASDIHHRISEAKNRLITAQQYALDPYATSRDTDHHVPDTARIYTIYQERCRTSNAMDFDDLLLNTYRLFTEHPEILQTYANALRFILVDEYQDTNYAQHTIIRLLTTEHHHICVVGDDAQSIYGFRGADIDNILTFQKTYPDARLFNLEQNYRSTQNIVLAANSLINKNHWQMEKNMYSLGAEGDKLLLKELASDREEAMYVTSDIKTRCKAEGLPYSDFAILYRANYQSRTFEEQLMMSNVPYHIYGGQSFYQRKEIKDTVAYFRLTVNHHDDEALRRIINYPTRGIGLTTLDKLQAAALDSGKSMWQVIETPEQSGLNVSKGTVNKLHAFRQLIESFTERLTTDDAYRLASDIVKHSGITQDIYSSHEPEYRSRQENLEEFLASVQEFVETAREAGEPEQLTDYLHDVALLTDRGDDDDDKPRVTLMTIHSAKGLEFPNVYVVGMEENVFPSPMSTDTPRQIEEERRLLYVAITRACRRCTLTYARSRYRYGKMEYDSPSRFLHDIDRHYITTTAPRRPSPAAPPKLKRWETESSAGKTVPGDVPIPRPTTEKTRQETSPTWAMTTSPTAANRPTANRPLGSAALRSKEPSAEGAPPQYLNVGTTVMHARFGRGTVEKIEGTGSSMKATVDFDNAGRKQLLLKFAKLTVVV